MTTVLAEAWRGHWIGAEPPDRDAGLGVGDGTRSGSFRRMLFRRTYDLAEKPEQVPARLTADSRYVLYVNGVEVGRGPQRSQPRRLHYDTWDLAPLLVAGANTIAVVVTYYGEATAFWQPATPSGALGSDAVLAFEARVGQEWWISDEAWRVHDSQAWSQATQGGLAGVPVEICDARRLPAGWQAEGFDDSAWDAAAILQATHIGGFGRSQPPTDPYGPLLPRTIGVLDGDVVGPATVQQIEVDAPADDPDPIDRVYALLDAHDQLLPTDAGLPVELELQPGRAHLLVIDFGRIVAGYTGFDLEAPEGAVIDSLYCERPYVQGDRNPITSAKIGFRYVARGRDDRFDALEVNGLRYVYMIITGPAGTARLSNLTVREHLYPQVGGASFASDDPEIDALYTAGIRTVRLNAQDAYTDCPTREQRAWVGDGVVHQMVHLTTNEDWRLAHNYVHLGNSPRPDGILPMTVVGEIEAGGGLTIPDWSLHWVHGVHNLYRYVGDRSELLELLPTVERVLRWYLPYVDERGTISDVPEWNLVDWAAVFTSGRSSLLTALWCRALLDYAEICDFVGNHGSAEWARTQHAGAVEGFEDFWDESRGSYVDHFIDGKRQPAMSQAAGALAIVSGLAPEERWSRIIDTITDADALVVRSWIGGDDGNYDQDKMLEQAQGDQRITWDVDREIVLAEPFFSYVVHDAVARAGRSGELVTLMRRWSEFLVDGYDTLGECWGWGTPVHGWSSAPTRDLIMYVLGVTPADPGFGRVRIAPDLGTLTQVEGRVPTPAGLVTARIADGSLMINSPVPAEVITPDGAKRDLPAGDHTLPWVGR